MFARLSARLSVHVEKLGSHWTDFHKIWYLKVFRKFKFYQNTTRMMVTLGEDLCTPIITFRAILLVNRNISDKFLEKIKTRIYCSVTYFFK